MAKKMLMFLGIVVLVVVGSASNCCDESVRRAVRDVEPPPGPMVVVDDDGNGNVQLSPQGQSPYTSSGPANGEIREDFSGTNIMSMKCIESDMTEHNANTIQANDGAASKFLRVTRSSVGLHWALSDNGSVWTNLLPKYPFNAGKVPSELLTMKANTLQMTDPSVVNCAEVKFQVKTPKRN